jgi:hypothetical protein
LNWRGTWPKESGDTESRVGVGFVVDVQVDDEYNLKSIMQDGSIITK